MCVWTITKFSSPLFRIWESPNTRICFVGLNILQYWSAPHWCFRCSFSKKTFEFHYFLAPNGDFDQNKNGVGRSACMIFFSKLHPLRPNCIHSDFTAHTPTSLHTLWPYCTHSSLLDTLLTAHTPNITAHTSKLTAHTPTTLFRSIYIRNIGRWVPLFF